MTSRRVEVVVTPVLLLAFAGAISPILTGQAAEAAAFMDEQIYAGARQVWPPLYALLGSLVMLRWRQFVSVAQSSALVAVIVALALLSTLWSIDPALTLRRSLGLAVTTALGLYLAAAFDQRDRLRLLVAALLVAVAGSLLFAWADPARGTHHLVNVGAWRGLFANKNSLGAAAALAQLALVGLFLARGCRPWLVAAGTALCAAALALSRSLTPAVALAGGLVAVLFVHALRSDRSGAARAPLLIGLVLTAGVTLAVFAPELLSVVGRDPTLTGRRELWDAVVAGFADRPLLGHGYGAFWRAPDGPGSALHELTRWLAGSAHNGFLDVALDLGLVGLTLVCALILLLAGRELVDLRDAPPERAFWAVPFLVFVLVYNLAETALLMHHNLTWALVAMSCAAGKVDAIDRGAARMERAKLGARPPPVS